MLMTLLRRKEEYNTGNKEHATHVKLKHIYTQENVWRDFTNNLPVFISRS